MYAWSITLIALLLGSCVAADDNDYEPMQMTTPNRCAKARAIVEVNEMCLASTDCYLSKEERKEWIEAKTDVYTWCDT